MKLKKIVEVKGGFDLWNRDKHKQLKLDKIEIPKRAIEIYTIKVFLEKKITGKELLKNIQERVKQLKGNFRQEEILKDWEQCITLHFLYPITKITVTCSSGTYMRTLVHEIGKKLGCGAIAYDIYRTKVGEYTL
jgi:tRNA U55 pseudouridine synthase TruB